MNFICLFMVGGILELVSAATIQKRQACADKLNNCQDYGKAVCSSYRQWAQENCQSFCGFCSGGQTPTQSQSQSCQDKINNCAALGRDVCTAYVEFSQVNCAKTCNLCAAKATSSGGGTSCKDKLSNCAAYGQSACSGVYTQWAKENCPKFCSLCTGGSSNTNSGTVQGYSDVCVYKGQYYQEGQSWRDGCEKNCTCVTARTGYYLCQAICPTYDNLPAGCQMVKPPGECCSKPQCPQSAGTCVYKGKTYQHGQSWDDGCQYKCTCKDGSTGFYQCRQKCVQWNLLPSCHLENPAPGKCCPTPKCPSNVVINYPQGYVPE